MIRSIYLIVTAIQCSIAFAPPRVPMSQIVRHADVMMPILKVSRHVSSDSCACVIGSSLVSRRMGSQENALTTSDETDEPVPESNTNNADESGPIVTSGGVGLGEFKPERKLGLEREAAIVGDPQTAQLDQPMNITKVLTELQAMQAQGPQKYCILGTRHCSFLHQQIVEML
jgi:hypothetical protein